MSAFRAEEAAVRGFERAKSYLVPRHASEAVRQRAEDILHDAVQRLGPVVEWYPSWHPLVSGHDGRDPIRTPSEQCGYKGLDHTVYFAHGFITCPYGRHETVVRSVEELKPHTCASISAELIDVELYAQGTRPVLVRCDWSRPLDVGHMIPKMLAVPLMLEQELPMWRWSEVGETWETMRPYFLGEPHGSRSSLFVSQETAMAMKRVWVAVIESGMFGPIRV